MGVQFLNHPAPEPCQLGYLLLGSAEPFGRGADQQVRVVYGGDPLKLARWHGGSLSVVLRRV
ncbi:hypothetical protein Misp01_30180 [Microtetraspora sp. NBRC 13810]|nr:hypothetical protein Misp01_30180 [Microtetraspora sp. NBRC 13810]